MIDGNVSQRRQERARSALTRCTRPRILIRIQGFVPGRAGSARAEQMHCCGGARLYGRDKLRCGRGTSACRLLLPLQILPQSQATLSWGCAGALGIYPERGKAAGARYGAKWQAEVPSLHLLVVRKSQPPGTFW